MSSSVECEGQGPRGLQAWEGVVSAPWMPLCLGGYLGGQLWVLLVAPKARLWHCVPTVLRCLCTESSDGLAAGHRTARLLTEQLRGSLPSAGTFFSGYLHSSSRPALPHCFQTPASVTPAAEQGASSGLGCGPPGPVSVGPAVWQVVVSPSKWGFLWGQLSVSSLLLPRTLEHPRAGSPACAAFLRQPQRGVVLAWRGCLWRESGSLLEAFVVCPPGRQAMTLKGH